LFKKAKDARFERLVMTVPAIIAARFGNLDLLDTRGGA